MLFPRNGFLRRNERFRPWEALVRETSRRRRRRLAVDVLEDRTLLASLKVGALVDMSKMLGSEEETTIAINPKNPNNLFAAAIGASTGQVASVSFDGGATWATRVMSSGSDGTPVACCDASAAFDQFGNLFMTYLSSSIHTIVLMSTDGGLTFTQLADFGSADQPTIVTGPGDQPGTQSVWVTYNFNGSIVARGARVTALGQVGSFTSAQTAPNSSGGNFGDIAIGPNGEVYVTYQNNTGGQGASSVLGNVDPDGLGPQGFSAQVNITSMNVGGFDYIPAQSSRSVDSEAGLAWDRSNGPHRGRLYLVYTDETPDESNNMDIMLRYSDDKGQTWSPALKVNDDNTTNSQFLPKIALDQTTGAVAIVWFDARQDNGSGPGDTDGKVNTDAILYGTVSLDGGQTVLPNVQIGGGPSNSATPGGNGNGGFNYGDYIGLAFHAGVFFPIWPDNSTALVGNPDRPNFDLATAAVTVEQLTVTPLPITPTENALFTGAVARFKPFKPNLPASNFTATIQWGNGNTSAGTISANPDGTFNVSGSNTYQEGGAYPLSVTVSDLSSGDVVTGLLTIQVTDIALQAQGTTISNLHEGDSFNGTVATFYDPDPDLHVASDYSATIHWGDDNTITTGTIVADPLAGPNHFVVTATHVFGGGTSAVVVTINSPGGGTAKATTTADVQDSVLTSSGLPISPQEGITASFAVAHFNDADPRIQSASNYFATIQWGDGTTSPGTISVDAINGGWLVSGSHGYDVGTYNITVTIGNNSGSNTTVAQTTATVQDAPLSATAFNYNSVEGQTTQKFLVAFTDADPRDNPVTRYAATVDWGDGTTSSSITDPGLVKIVINTDGGYLVQATHAYRVAGTYLYSVTVAETVGGATTTASAVFSVSAGILSAKVVTTATPYEGNPFSGAIATFKSTNPIALASDFTATVDWGDGTTSSGNALTITKTPSGEFAIQSAGTKVYQTPGSYVVGVVVTSASLVQSSANGSIQVLDAPLTAQGVPVTGQAKTDLTNLHVASFNDLDPTPNLGEFSAIIVWGDGTRSPGTIVANGSGGFDVVGSHHYDRAGQFAGGVAVLSRFGSVVMTGMVAKITPRLFTLTGDLSPSSQSTALPNSGVTRDSTPTFEGQSEPGATVNLYVVPGTPGAQWVSIGSAIANSGGRWSVTVSSLGDGSYTIVGSAVDSLGQVSSTPTLLLGGQRPLVVDTHGPRVSKVAVDARTGQVNVTLTDDGSGLLPSALANAGNYSLSLIGGRSSQTLRVSDLSIRPSTPNTTQTATLTFGGLRRFAAGDYVIEISAPGLTDRAGNVLDERYYVPFPGLYTQPGQNFVAEFSSNGQVVSAIRQYVPPPEIIAAQRHNQLIQSRLRLRGRRG